MNYTLKYGSSVTVLPTADILPALKKASREELAVLIYISKYPNADTERCLSELDIKKEQLIGAMIFWKNIGLVDFDRDELLAESKAERAQKEYPQQEAIRSKLPSNSSVPHYTSEETAAFLETHTGVASLIDCCQMTFGKIFNTAETEIIIGMMDYLSLDSDYILLLFEYCAGIGKKSIRYAEKLAIALTDKGISKYTELEDYFADIARMATFEAPIRSMLGIGKRELTKKEQEAFSRWCITWGFTPEAVRKAYDITVNRTKEPSVAYINSILKNWHSEGAVTVEAIDALLAKERDARQPSTPAAGTFETDDFFEASILRSYKK